MKKITSIILAILVLFSMFAIPTSATTAPTITVVSTANLANVGDVFRIAVSTSVNSKICAVRFIVEYDTEYFQLIKQSSDGTFTLEDWGGTPGKIKFVGATASHIKDDAKFLFSVEFKVLKTGGTINIIADEVYVVDGENDVDVASQVASKTVTIACPHANKETSVTKEVSCEQNGEKTTVCSDCGAVLKKETVPAFGHRFEKWNVVQQPTCTEDGYEKSKCENCGISATRKILMHGHEYGEWTVVTPATEYEEGVKERTCHYCGNKEEEVIPAMGHYDNDPDGYCDGCGDLLCDHNCHKGGIAGFFWKIGNLFNKIFRTKRYCECGAAHY